MDKTSSNVSDYLGQGISEVEEFKDELQPLLQEAWEALDRIRNLNIPDALDGHEKFFNIDDVPDPDDLDEASTWVLNFDSTDYQPPTTTLDLADLAEELGLFATGMDRDSEGRMWSIIENAASFLGEHAEALNRLAGHDNPTFEVVDD